MSGESEEDKLESACQIGIISCKRTRQIQQKQNQGSFGRIQTQGRYRFHLGESLRFSEGYLHGL